MTPALIGINGFKRSGKGTLANFIADEVPGCVQVGFADKLKVLAAKTLGWQDSDGVLIWIMDEFKEDGDLLVSLKPDLPRVVTGRQMLQNLGNEARGVFEPEFWINQVLPEPSRHMAGDIRRIENVSNLAERYPGARAVLITDLRYPNEAERVRALGGKIVEVIRPGVESDGHASEQPLPPSLIDWLVVNDGSLDDLRDRATECVTEVLYGC